MLANFIQNQAQGGNRRFILPFRRATQLWMELAVSRRVVAKINYLSVVPPRSMLYTPSLSLLELIHFSGQRV